MRAAVALMFLVACGDDGAAPIDAAPDTPPIDATPDGPACAAPSKVCGAACIDVSSDEANCGDCGMACQGGAACDGTCTCPTAFIGANLTPGQFDQFQAAGGITVAINPNIEGGSINPFLVGFAADTPLATDIDLSTVTLGEAPFVGVGYRFDVGTMAFDSAFVATAGTLRLTDACTTHVQGTLTNATFRGIHGDLQDPMIDPDGCTATIASVAFEMGTGTCP